MATIRQRAENGQGSIRWINDRECECIVQSQYLNPKTGKPKRFKRKLKIDDNIRPTRKVQSEIEDQVRQSANMAKDAWEKELIKGNDNKVNKSKTFGEYMDDYLDTVVQPSITASGYKSYISALSCNFYKQPISKYQLQMLNTQVFQEYFDTILARRSKKTCSIPIQLCKRLCKWLVDRSLLKENYAEQTIIKKEIADEYDKKRNEELKNQKMVFTSEDIQKFYYAFKNNMGETAVIVLFLLETGMRAGEFSALKLDNVDLDRRRIDIVESRSTRYVNNDKTQGVEFYTKVPKNGDGRFVMMSDLCKECVEYMIAQTKLHCKDDNPLGLLYPTFRTGKERSVSSMETCFKDLCNKLDIDRDVRLTKGGMKRGLCLHSLRHTADTIANTAKGANVVNTALAMGHNAIRTENIYTHATEEALSTITTPSQAVIDEYKNDKKKEDVSEEEMYEMYLKLKEKFESKS